RLIDLVRDRCGEFPHRHHPRHVCELRLGVAERFLRLLPIVHVHKGAVPLENTPLLVQQRARVGYAPSVRAIGTVENTNLDAVWGSGLHTADPLSSGMLAIDGR